MIRFCIHVEEAKKKRCPRPTLCQIAKPNPLSPNGQVKFENAFVFPACLADECMKWQWRGSSENAVCIPDGSGLGYCSE